MIKFRGMVSEKRKTGCLNSNPMKKYFLLIIVFNFLNHSFLQGQTIKALQSENDSQYPRIQWYSTDRHDTLNFLVYRTDLKKVDFKPILPLQGTFKSGDTTIYWIVDTTLTEKALYKYFISLPGSNDSVVRSEVLYGHNMGIMPPPQVVHFNAESAKDRKAIKLNWKLNYNFTVNTLSIYRSMNYDDGFELVAHVAGTTESYTDAVDVANEAYYYFFVIHDYFGYQRPSVRFHGISTFSEKPFPPQNFEIATINDQAKLTWTRLGNNITGYRIYRQIGDFGNFHPINKMFYTSGKEVSYVDSTISGLSNKVVKYYVVSVSDGFSESNPSDTLQIHVKGEIIKSAPQECDYVTDSAGRVMLIWSSQEKDAEVSGYNVYRSAAGSDRIKLNGQLVPYDINYFTDETAARTGEYEYEIETVSITGMPSLTRASVKVYPRALPQNLILSLRKTGKGISIKGVPLNEPGIKEIVLYRQVNAGVIKQLAKLSPNNINYTDTDVKAGDLISYTAEAVYDDGTRQIVNAGVVIRY
jgi:fibronectin type 3 domain-containing protein